MYDLEREREYIRMASEEADLTPEEEYEFYSKYALRTKEDILTEIKVKQNKMRENDLKVRSEEFYQRLHLLLDIFYDEISSHLLMEPLDNFWGYSIKIRETGIELLLEHFLILYDHVGKDFPEWWKYNSTHFLVSDDGYSILEVRSKLLTLEEYGNVYGVGAGTVRQWIRRGKLRSASKFGNEWRIPELADKPNRGYSSGTYSWKIELPDPPAEIPDINYADTIDIYKNKNTGTWTAVLTHRDKEGSSKRLSLDNKTKEKLELYLISHPLVECLNNYIGDVSQKDGSRYKMLKPNLKLEEQTTGEA